jgi:hypothetical protein
MSTSATTWLWYKNLPDHCDLDETLEAYASKIVENDQLHLMWKDYTPLSFFCAKPHHRLSNMLAKKDGLDPNYGLKDGLCGSRYPLHTLEEDMFKKNTLPYQTWKILIAKGASMDYKSFADRTAITHWRLPDISFYEAVAEVFWRKIFFHEKALKYNIFTTEIIELICQYI